MRIDQLMKSPVEVHFSAQCPQCQRQLPHQLQWQFAAPGPVQRLTQPDRGSCGASKFGSAIRVRSVVAGACCQWLQWCTSPAVPVDGIVHLTNSRNDALRPQLQFTRHQPQFARSLDQCNPPVAEPPALAVELMVEGPTVFAAMAQVEHWPQVLAVFLPHQLQ